MVLCVDWFQLGISHWALSCNWSQMLAGATVIGGLDWARYPRWHPWWLAVKWSSAGYEQSTSWWPFHMAWASVAQPRILKESMPRENTPRGSKLKLPNQLKAVPRNDSVLSTIFYPLEQLQGPPDAVSRKINSTSWWRNSKVILQKSIWDGSYYCYCSRLLDLQSAIVPELA